MSRIIANSTPAERFCRCSFSETFESKAAVVANGGVITGTPSIAHGLATLNGTTDYITYALTGNEFNSAEISIVIEFWPDFDYDNNAESALFCTDTSVEYTVYKRNNAGSNELGILLGGTLIAFVVQGTYSPYWRVGERNVLVISGTTGATNAWLNGTQILTASATAWTPSGRTSLTIGRRTNGTRYFDGKIGPIKVFKGLLDAQDALNYYNKNTYSYMNDCVLHLPMRAGEHDPSNTDGIELIADGTTEAIGTASWPSGSSAIITKEVGTRPGGSGVQVLKVAFDGVASPYTYQAGVFVIGEKYAIEGWAYGDGATGLPTLYTSGAKIWGGSTDAAWQRVYLEWTATNTNIQLYNLSGAGYVLWDDVTVQKIIPQTLDIANGNHAQFGDGSTPTTYPTKLAKRGYYFDGGDYLNAGDTTSLRLTSTGTVACFFEASNYSSDVGLIVKGQFATDRNGYFLFLHGATGVVRGIVANGATKNEVDAVTPTPAGIHTAILVWDGSLLSLYIDGKLEDTATQSINALSDGYDLVFGTVSDGAGNELTGNIFEGLVTADPLSQIQVADLHIRMMKGINQV